MTIYEDIGICVPDIELPRAGTDIARWAVIACDQFTSEPEYWRQVRKFVGDAPSTLNLVLPEIDLEAPDKDRRIRDIQASMRQYLESGLLRSRPGMIYLERRLDGRTRKGVLLCLDLERYDYTSSATSLIRATEGTIVERLPPRMAIREGASLELPHILVLIDDPDRTVIEPLQADSRGQAPLYDFELMLGSGHLTGYGLDRPAQDGVVSALRALANSATFGSKYGVDRERPVLLFAMGDGNHSLATAKAVWEKIKPSVGMSHPARYALVEIENVHDDGLQFEPIHRVLFGLKLALDEALRSHFGNKLNVRACASNREMIQAVDGAAGPTQVVGWVSSDAGSEYRLIEISRSDSNLAVGTLQRFLDEFLRQGGAEKIDYVHGADVVERLGSQPGHAGFYLPGMGKSSLFKTVILDGSLPRKTFSMGAAREKRFYMEARRIS